MSTVIQSSYNERIGVAVAGLIANLRDSICRTKQLESATLGFGLAVCQGTADDGITLGGSALTKFQGVSVRDVTLVPDNSDQYVQTNNVAVLQEGDIWVQIGAAVGPADAVYFNPTTGVFYKTSAGGALGPIAGARWLKTAALADGIALLSLSGYNQAA